MNGQLFTIKDVINRGWELTKANLGFLVGYQIILWLLVGVLAAVQDRPLLHFLMWLILITVKMGFYKSSLMITDGIKPEFDQLYANWRKIITWTIASLFFGIMFSIGLILLIVPGLWVAAAFGMYPFFLLDREIGPIETLKQTARGTKGHRWEIFLLFLVLLLLNILGFILLGVGLLISVPVSLLALATVYQRIKAQPEVLMPQTNEGAKT